MEREFYINILNLKKHPEGGYFREVYRSEDVFEKEKLSSSYNSNRNYSTSIYYLLADDDISAFHRLQSDEIWHFYIGNSLNIYIIDEEGILKEISLGSDLKKGESFQCTLPKNSWFGAKLKDSQGFALIGCTVSPGFDFKDFELAERDKLLSLYPKYKNTIIMLTK